MNRSLQETLRYCLLGDYARGGFGILSYRRFQEDKILGVISSCYKANQRRIDTAVELKICCLFVSAPYMWRFIPPVLKVQSPVWYGSVLTVRWMVIKFGDEIDTKVSQPNVILIKKFKTDHHLYY